jgi:hypothetical protein
VVFLDDATADNGALRVLPGSHRHGPARTTRPGSSQIRRRWISIVRSRSSCRPDRSCSSVRFSCTGRHRIARRRTVVRCSRPSNPLAVLASRTFPIGRSASPTCRDGSTASRSFP